MFKLNFTYIYKMYMQLRAHAQNAPECRFRIYVNVKFAHRE